MLQKNTLLIDSDTEFKWQPNY